VQAFTGLPVAITCYGSDAVGRLYSDHLFQGGGQGASAQGDGKSALLWPTSASVYPEGVAVRTPGLFGGKPGGETHGWLIDRDGRRLKDYGVGELATLTAADEIVELQLAGGAGFGDPLERPLALVESDL